MENAHIHFRAPTTVRVAQLFKYRKHSARSARPERSVARYNSAIRIRACECTLPTFTLKKTS